MPFFIGETKIALPPQSVKQRYAAYDLGRFETSEMACPDRFAGHVLESLY